MSYLGSKLFRNKHFWNIPLIASSIVLLLAINFSSISAFLYALLLSVILYVSIFRKFNSEVLLLFGFYSLVTIFIYLTQLWSLPEYYGFSGGAGIGTDDCRFFFQVSDGWGYLPNHCFQLRSNHPYSSFLNFITPFQINHIFDVIFINSIGATLLPILVREFVIKFVGDKKVAWYAFIFTAICPFIISNSLILMRDGWVATLFISSIYFLVSRKYIFLVAAILLLFYLRFASGAVTLAILMGFLLIDFKNSEINSYLKPILFFGLITLLSFIIILVAPLVLNQFGGSSLVENLYREGYVEEFILGGGSGRDVNPLYEKLLSLPAIIRVPLSSVFYIVSPLFSPDNVIVKGIMVPRNFLFSIIYPILAIFYFKYVIQALVVIKKQGLTPILFIAIVFVFTAILLSQLSIQPRHKTMIMPLFYIIAAFGLVNNDKAGRELGRNLIILFVMAQLVILVI